MFDSSSKPSPSILKGNFPNFGDFDACINLKPPDDIFKGKFCLASIMFETIEENLIKKKKFNELKHKILGGETYMSEFDDVSHKKSENFNFFY